MSVGNSEEEKTPDSFSEKVVSAAACYEAKWKEGRYSSRKIVKEVGNAVGKGVYGVRSCAALLALENRIAERYATLLNTLLHYFSWKRESRLLSSLKSALKIPERVTVARYVRSSESHDGEEGGEGERSGEGKKGEEKAKEKQEELSVKKSGEAAEIKDDFREEEEPLTEEREETEPEKKPIGEEKEGAEETLRRKPNEASSENPSENREEEKGRTATEESPRRTDEKEPPKGVPKAEEKAERVEKRQPSAEPAVDLPLERYGRDFGQKQESDSFRYEHYNRPAEVLPPRSPSEVIGEKEGVPADKAERRSPEKQREKPLNKPTDKPAEKPMEKPSERRSERPAVKEALSEENKARIQAREAFAKMSEEELTAIQKAMQESLNREMERAEQSGEIYKMPITVKEAFEKSDEDRSARRDKAPAPDTVIKK